MVAETGRSPVRIAPLRNGVAAEESEWIEVTDGSGLDASPWWSPDGGLLYFFSRRDGFECLWAQRLDPATKKPVGPAFDVYHFHGARRVVNTSTVGPALSANKLVFSMGELSGNIWMAEQEGPR
jgi:hypothetical protein